MAGDSRWLLQIVSSELEAFRFHLIHKPDEVIDMRPQLECLHSIGKQQNAEYQGELEPPAVTRPLVRTDFAT
jgi:hypothetical protein